MREFLARNKVDHAFEDVRKEPVSAPETVKLVRRHQRAFAKLHRKRCDLIVCNGPDAMHASETTIEVLDAQQTIIARFAGSKADVGQSLIDLVGRRWAARE